MRRQRVRPVWSEEDLARIYATPHDHTIYGRGHGERVAETILLAKQNLPDYVRSVADLSCGNATIARALGLETTVLGDFAPGYEHQGRIEDTIKDIDLVEVFILSETLEHLDAPLDVLIDIRGTSNWLVLSTPLEAWDDGNGEHYWAWDREGVEEMLALADWEPRAFSFIDSRTYGEPYLYGIWVCY